MSRRRTINRNYETLRFSHSEDVKFNERIINQWQKLISDENNNEVERSILTREKRKAENEVLNSRRFITNSAVLLFKLKDKFDFNKTKDFNKFQRSIENLYKYKVMNNSGKDMVSFDEGRYEEERYLNYSGGLGKLLQKHKIMSFKKEIQKNYYGEKEVNVCQQGFSGHKIKENYMPRQYRPTGFICWDIFKGDDLNKSRQIGTFVSYMTGEECNMILDTDKEMYLHPQTIMQNKLNEVKESEFVKNVLGEYYELVDELCTDTLNQKGKPIDMFGSDERELQERAENRADEERRKKEREEEKVSAH